MIYAVVLFTTAFLIAGVAAYFSVYGLAHIFAGSFTAAIVMGSVLELGKLVATSFLYRSWGLIGWWLRVYLFTAIAGLMLITSAGIFGYLSNAYQQDTNDLKVVETRVDLINKELAALTSRELQINEDISRVGDNFVTARQNLMRQYNDEQQQLRTRITELRVEQLELNTKLIEVEAHTGPIIYIAKAFGKGIDEAVMWVILLVIVVFDPLAIALTVGANIVWKNRQAAATPMQPDESPASANEDSGVVREEPVKITNVVECLERLSATTEVPNIRGTLNLSEDFTQNREKVTLYGAPVVSVPFDLPIPTPAEPDLHDDKVERVDLESDLRQTIDMISAVLEADDRRTAALDVVAERERKRLGGALYPTPQDVETVKTYKTRRNKPVT